MSKKSIRGTGWKWEGYERYSLKRFVFSSGSSNTKEEFEDLT